MLLTSLLPTPFNFLTFTLGTGLLLEHVHCLGELCQVRMRIVAHTREYGEAVEQPTYGGWERGRLLDVPHGCAARTTHRVRASKT